MRAAGPPLPDIYYVLFPWRKGGGIFFHRGFKNGIGVYISATRISGQFEHFLSHSYQKTFNYFRVALYLT